MDINLSLISIKEFRSLLDEKQTAEEGDVILAKACGVTVDEIQALPYPDYRRLVKAFYEKAREPLADPN